MKKIFIIILSLILTTNVFADKCYNPVATPLILESDKNQEDFLKISQMSTMIIKFILFTHF